MVGSPNCSTCWSTGSGARLAKVSPARSRTGRRFAMRDAGGGDHVGGARPDRGRATTMIWRRFFALAKPIAASAIDCSFWPRQVGSTSWTGSSASPRQVTLPWPKIAKTPAKSGTSGGRRWSSGQSDSGPGPAPWSAGRSSSWNPPSTRAFGNSSTLATGGHRLRLWRTIVQCRSDGKADSTQTFCFFLAA